MIQNSRKQGRTDIRDKRRYGRHGIRYSRQEQAQTDKKKYKRGDARGDKSRAEKIQHKYIELPTAGEKPSRSSRPLKVLALADMGSNRLLLHIAAYIQAPPPGCIWLA